MSKSRKDKNCGTKDGRRKIVKNILAGATVTAGIGTAANNTWIKPVINTIVLPTHAQTSMDPMIATCCPYYFDATQNWCYDDGAGQNGNTGPVPGGFSEYNWDQPANCPTPND